MPFAGFKDFDECVRKNRDKNDPRAYCASIMQKVEGSSKKKRTKAQKDTAKKMGVKI